MTENIGHIVTNTHSEILNSSSWLFRCQIHTAHVHFLISETLQGNCLDSLARKALWDVGLDYGHGTGHGIGMYLNVHEGPMGVSWRPLPDDPGLQEGMFLSDGGYRAAAAAAAWC